MLALQSHMLWVKQLKVVVLTPVRLNVELTLLLHSGKAFKRAVEYHLINALAIIAMKFEALPEGLLTPELQTECKNLRDALHARKIHQ